VGLIGCVVSLATIPFLGYSPENPFAMLAVTFLAPGLLIPLALWILHAVITQVWVDDRGNWVTAADTRGTWFRIASSAPLAPLALGATVFGFAPLSDFVPWMNDLFEHYLGAIAIGLVLSSVVIAGVVGAAVMGGWRAAAVGLIFGFGFLATTFGAYTNSGPWTVVGWSALTLAIAGYYLIGEVTGHLPSRLRDRFASPSGAVLGAALALAGVVTGQWLLGGLGAASVAAWLGVRAARRRSRAAERSSAGD
jgi:hypothetical protein